MFVPDDARKRRKQDKLTPAAWYVYESHCAARNHKTGLSYASKERIAAAESLALKTVKNALTELRQKGWIAEEGRGMRLLVGDFTPVNKKPLQASPNEDAESPQSGTGEPESETESPQLGTENPQLGTPSPQSGTGEPESETESPQLGTENPQLGTPSPQSGTGAYIDRARGVNQLFSSSTTSPETSTHTPDRAPLLVEQAPAARVRVSNCTDEELRQYARANGLTPGWETTARRTGEWDGDVTLFIESRKVENVLKARAAPSANSKTFREVADTLRSIMRGFPSYDAAGYIEQLDADEATKAQLRAEFLRGPAKQEVAARAHAPP